MLGVLFSGLVLIFESKDDGDLNEDGVFFKRPSREPARASSAGLSLSPGVQYLNGCCKLDKELIFLKP